MINVDLRDIRYFAAVVEHGSLTKAAAALRVSQPALSHAVGRLEEALGGALWMRLPNRRARVRATELGERVLDRGGRALAELSALTEDAAKLRGVEMGVLRAGSVQSLASTLLPRWATCFLAAYPGVVLDLPLVTSENAGELLRSGKLDAALVVGTRALDPDLPRMPCGEQALCCVMKADHELARGRHIELAALFAEAFVLVPRSTFFGAALEEACRQAGFEPRVRARLSSISGLCALVRAGVGVTILPMGSVHAADTSLVELPLGEGLPRRPIHLIWRSDVRPPPALEAFIAVGRAGLDAS